MNSKTEGQPFLTKEERKRSEMYYAEPVYRPPSEAYSLLVQATVGCSSLDLFSKGVTVHTLRTSTASWHDLVNLMQDFMLLIPDVKHPSGYCGQVRA